jgi:hypothetical protein
MVTIEAAQDATEIDLDGVVDETRGIRYVGRAKRFFGGQWRCLADVGGALCLVEVTVRPTVHVGGDPGDEDDRGPRDAQLDRDLQASWR